MYLYKLEMYASVELLLDNRLVNRGSEQIVDSVGAIRCCHECA